MGGRGVESFVSFEVDGLGGSSGERGFVGGGGTEVGEAEAGAVAASYVEEGAEYWGAGARRGGAGVVESSESEVSVSEGGRGREKVGRTLMLMESGISLTGGWVGGGTE